LAAGRRRRATAETANSTGCVPECVKQVKARIKCTDVEVAANSICLLDALVASTTAPFRLQVVEKVVSRLGKMATPKNNYPPPVVLCARAVLIKWAETFPNCREFVDAARSLRNTPSTPAQGHGTREARVLVQGHVAQDEGGEEEEVPAARPRDDSSTVGLHPPATGVLMDAQAAVALAQPPARGDPLNSRFYQSALRAAQKAAAQEQAQRRLQQEADHSAALALVQASQTRNGVGQHQEARSQAQDAAAPPHLPPAANAGCGSEGMSVGACSDVSALFDSLLLDAPRNQKPDEVLAAVSVKASAAHVRVQQLLRSGDSDDSKLLKLHERLTASLATYASLGSNTALPEPWLGEAVVHESGGMPTDELIALLATEGQVETQPPALEYSLLKPSAPSITPSVLAAVRDEATRRPPSCAASQGLEEHMQRFGLDHGVQTLLRDNGVKTLPDVLEVEDADAQFLGLNLVDRKKLAKLRAHVQELSDAGVLGQLDSL